MRVIRVAADAILVASDTVDCAHTRSGGGTADEFIEMEVTDLSMAVDKPLVMVATADRACGTLSAGAGAVIISGTTLLEYVRKTDKETKELLRRQHADSLAKGGRRLTQRTATSLLELRSRLNEKAKAEAMESKGQRARPKDRTG